MLSALVAVQRDFLVDGAAHEVFERILHELIGLSDSEYGFIGEVLHDELGEPFVRMHGLTDVAWDAHTRTLYERARGGGFEFRELNSLYGAVLRTAAPVISNAPATDTRSCGLPKGHPPLRGFLGLPLIQGAQLVGIVGLANAPGGYDRVLVDDLAPMLATCTSMIVALRLEQERNAAEQALLESETHFRNLANSGSALIWTSGADGRCSYFNEPWLRFTGRSLEQELGEGWAEGVHPDDRAQCLSDYERAFAAQEPFRLEYRLRHVDGGYRWISDEGSPRYDSSGRFLGYIGYCLDVTDRKRAGLALDALAARYTMLSGDAFYEAVCRHVGEALHLDLVFVGQCLEEGGRINVRAGWKDGAAVQPFSYALAGTPSELALQGGSVVIGSGVAARFPDDPGLRDGAYEAYCGVPLADKEGQALGLMVGLSRRPLDDQQGVRELLEIFDGPVSAELIRERGEAALTRRIAFGRMVARISSELMPARADEVDGLVLSALAQIGRYADADRAFVFDITEDGRSVSNTHEWCAPGVSPQAHNLQGVGFEGSLFCQIIKRLEIVDFPDVSLLPECARQDRELLQSQGIQSTLAAPMVVNGRLLGFVGLDSVRCRRQWSGEEKTLMSLVGNALAGVIERKRVDESLRESEARYRSVVESVREVIFQVDADGRCAFLNRAWHELTGFAVEASIGRPFVDYVHPDDRHLHQEVFELLMRREEASCTQALRYLRVGGGFRWVELHARPVLGAGREVQGISGTLNDITIQKEHEAQLKYVAHYDALTGLPNRVLLHDRLSRSMAQARRRGQLLAVAYIDLDGFKEVNDGHGHHVGDQLLTTVAARMKGTLRDADSVSRLGGDEFVAVLVDLPDLPACKHLVQRLLQAVAQVVQVGGAELQVSASIGLTLYPQEEALEPDQLLRQADLAMYQAKLAGKNRYHFFDTDQDRDVRGRHEGVARIHEALANDEFVLFYQPKVNMRSGALTGVEALIRWQHPELGLIEPAAFLPMVEDQPVAVALGDWVISAALEQLERWKSLGLTVPVSVNISARHLQAPDFMMRLQEALTGHPGLAPGSLELEVLESSALESMTRVTQIVEACARIGVSFALDDFGTGYSGLAYLKRLPAARLKIDQLFVREMLDDPEDLAILEAVMGLAHAFRREVVAEGVESEAHGRVLLQLGCEVGQGYVIARPMEGESLPQWVATWAPPASWRRQSALSREELALVYAQVEHRALVRALAAKIADGTQIDNRLVVHGCSLGRWIELALAEQRHEEVVLRELAQAHDMLHETIETLAARYRAADAAAVVEGLGAVRRRLDVMLGQINRLLA